MLETCDIDRDNAIDQSKIFSQFIFNTRPQTDAITFYDYNLEKLAYVYLNLEKYLKPIIPELNDQLQTTEF